MSASTWKCLAMGCQVLIHQLLKYIYIKYLSLACIAVTRGADT
jgi:hypothetical protein